MDTDLRKNSPCDPAENKNLPVFLRHRQTIAIIHSDWILEG